MFHRNTRSAALCCWICNDPELSMILIIDHKLNSFKITYISRVLFNSFLNPGKVI
jgi:hypothetical protein